MAAAPSSNAGLIDIEAAAGRHAEKLTARDSVFSHKIRFDALRGVQNADLAGACRAGGSAQNAGSRA
jgi:hypothetical protein